MLFKSNQRTGRMGVGVKLEQKAGEMTSSRKLGKGKTHAQYNRMVRMSVSAGTLNLLCNSLKATIIFHYMLYNFSYTSSGYSISPVLLMSKISLCCHPIYQLPKLHNISLKIIQR